jgi:antitoxin component of RelBE/YafQ-DinJ toxin-antitoxin module
LKDLEESFVSAIIICLKKAEKVEEIPLELFLPQLMINTLKDASTKGFIRKLIEIQELNNWET